MNMADQTWVKGVIVHKESQKERVVARVHAATTHTRDTPSKSLETVDRQQPQVVHVVYN